MTQGTARARRTLRLVAAAIVAGFGAGAVAGLGARLAMFGIRLSNGAFNGATTHAGYENGVWTIEGTVSVVFTGAFFGLPGGTLYLLVRSALGPWRALRAVAFSGLLLAWFGDVVLDGSYEFSRFVAPTVSVAAFAALFPLYGVAVALVADALAPVRAARHPRVRIVAAIVLGLIGALSAWEFATDLRFTYGF
jgi:hypothetical protein